MTAPTPTDVLAMLDVALSAPSGDNAQPWRLRIDESGVDVMHDAERAASSLNVRDLASRMALGALLETLRLEAETRGLTIEPRLDPDPERPDCWARVTWAPMAAHTSELHSAIRARHTNRAVFDGRPLRRGALEALSALEGIVMLDARADIARVGALAGRAGIARGSSRVLHDEMYRWIRWTESEALSTCDGLDVRSLGLNAAERVGFAAERTWWAKRIGLALGAAKLQGSYTQRLVASASAVGMVTAPSLETVDAVAAGVHMQRVWLQATALGLAFSPLAELTLLPLAIEHGSRCAGEHADELLAVRDEVRQVFGLGARGVLPVFMFRVGYADAPAVRSRRRRACDLLVDAGH